MNIVKLNNFQDSTPLAKVVDNKLVIEVPLDHVHFAFHHMDYNEGYEDREKFYSKYIIENKEEFNQEFVNRLNGEIGEDGSTPITRFLDKQFKHMIEDGDLGIVENTEMKDVAD